MILRKILKYSALVTLVAFASLVFMIKQPFVLAVKSDTIAVDSYRLQQHVKYLSVDLYPRSFDFPDHLNAAADYIQTELAASGIKVEAQVFEVNGQRYRNLIAHFGPTEGKVLVIGAHYDSHGDGSGVVNAKNHSHTPGADDNASGVAGLIELAKLLAKNPPPRAVELVAYTLEEPPFFRTEQMGSAVHARSLTLQQRDVDMMVSLEMIGYFTQAKNSQAFPVPMMHWFYPTTGNFIAVVGRRNDAAETRRVKAALINNQLPVESLSTPVDLVGTDFSDHLNYWAQGYPAVMITDTAFLRNTEYHQAGDTWTRLDYTRMAQVVQGVYRLAQQPVND